MNRSSASPKATVWLANLVAGSAILLILVSMGGVVLFREPSGAAPGSANKQDGGSIYHRNGQIAYRGPGWTDSGFAWFDDGARACIGPGRTDSGMGYYRNGATSYVGPGRTNSGYAYWPNGQVASRDGSGIQYSLGPGVMLHVSVGGCRVWVSA